MGCDCSTEPAPLPTQSFKAAQAPCFPRWPTSVHQHRYWDMHISTSVGTIAFDCTTQPENLRPRLSEGISCYLCPMAVHRGELILLGCDYKVGRP